MSGFDTAIERVLGHEGGYVNDLRDAGGETNWGVTKATARANGYSGRMREMTRNQAKEIYRKAFWERFGCGDMPFAIGYQYFDACVNHGRGNAARFLQRALGVADDGIIGPVTKAAIHAADISELVRKFNGQRLSFYTKLKAFDAFGRGWVNRVALNLRHAVTDGCAHKLADYGANIGAYVKANRHFTSLHRDFLKHAAVRMMNGGRF
ncbi:Predicted lysozyme (DUF847) [Neisseria zoodegmatis]|uniref:Predicted lysozyme (DUF847) n=1 Tax=Neisseria zoodegmatis TaxID=326523 RepID=A0AB38DMP0_9NEIS|nr:hypothetical protein BWD10_10195 [Neisseria zoodegmatis]SNU78675.1 Predicted lysozyme (DUF847) [Neisseria zoodegmatis]